TMQRFNWHVGQQIILRGTAYPVNLSLTIVGVLGEKAPPSVVIFRRDYMDEAIKPIIKRSAFVSTFWVAVDRPQSIPAVIAQIDETFANSEAETLTESEADFLGAFMDSYRSIFQLAEILGVIVVIAIG